MDAIILEVPHIQGESRLNGFEGAIEVLSFSHGVAMQVSGDGSAGERTSPPSITRTSVARSTWIARPRC